MYYLQFLKTALFLVCKSLYTILHTCIKSSHPNFEDIVNERTDFKISLQKSMHS